MRDVSSSGSAAVLRRHLLERYEHLRDDHLRYMEKWGLVRPSRGENGEIAYSFTDLATIRQAEAELATGTPFRALLKSLHASRSGQLELDFRIEAPAAKVLQLRRPVPPPLADLMDAAPPAPPSSAEDHFNAASMLDEGDPRELVEAFAAYRRALEIDPYLVPALINLANLHYAEDQIPEAHALYERAITLDPTVFEAHFNLGNILHDLRRYSEAQACYREAIKRNPTYADAHFYLAVTLEKGGRAAEARTHWRAYQQLAPHGEWVHLAREFSDPS